MIMIMIIVIDSDIMIYNKKYKFGFSVVTKCFGRAPKDEDWLPGEPTMWLEG